MQSKKRVYYVHALLGFHKCTYTRRGPFRWLWVTTFIAHHLMGSNPYGTATITNSPECPTIKD